MYSRSARNGVALEAFHGTMNCSGGESPHNRLGGTLCGYFVNAKSRK